MPWRKHLLEHWFRNVNLPIDLNRQLRGMSVEQRHLFLFHFLQRLREVMKLEELLLKETVRDEKHLQKIINILRTAYLASVDEKTRLVIQVTQVPSNRFVPSLEELQRR